jgi:hypothetical protein
VQRLTEAEGKEVTDALIAEIESDPAVKARLTAVAQRKADEILKAKA